MKKIVILGSTGSVGVSVANVVRMFPDKFSIIGIASNTNVKGLVQQSEEFNPKYVAISDESLSGELKREISGNSVVMSGESALNELACLGEADIIVLSVPGFRTLWHFQESGAL